MRGRTSRNRLVVGALLVVAVGVWGTVGYRAWVGVQPADEGGHTERAVQVEASDRLEQRYEADFPDPLDPVGVARSDQGAASSPSGAGTAPPRTDDPLSRTMSDLDALRQFPGGSEREAAPPAAPEEVWRLRGVVGDAAILESDDGMTRLARVGDYLGDDRVVEIGRWGIRLRSTTGEYEVGLR